MSIKQAVYCDICEWEHGQESPEALIQKPSGCPGFPQVQWTYFKLGSEIHEPVGQAPQLSQRWQGSVNRMEFCPDHAHQLNALLKAFMKNKDSRVLKIVDEIASEDSLRWAEKQDAIAKQFSEKKKKFEEKNGTDG